VRFQRWRCVQEQHDFVRADDHAERHVCSIIEPTLGGPGRSRSFPFAVVDRAHLLLQVRNESSDRASQNLLGRHVGDGARSIYGRYDPPTAHLVWPRSGGPMTFMSRLDHETIFPFNLFRFRGTRCPSSGKTSSCAHAPALIDVNVSTDV